MFSFNTGNLEHIRKQISFWYNLRARRGFFGQLFSELLDFLVRHLFAASYFRKYQMYELYFGSRNELIARDGTGGRASWWERFYSSFRSLETGVLPRTSGINRKNWYLVLDFLERCRRESIVKTDIWYVFEISGCFSVFGMFCFVYKQRWSWFFFGFYGVRLDVNWRRLIQNIWIVEYSWKTPKSLRIFRKINFFDKLQTNHNSISNTFHL